MALDLAKNIVCARFLGREEFGRVATILMVLSFVNLYGELGGKEFVIRAGKGSARASLSTVFLVGLAITIFLAGTLAASAGLVATFLDDERLKPLLVVGAVACAKPLLRIPQAVWEAQMRFGISKLPEVGAQVVALSCVLLLALTGRLSPMMFVAIVVGEVWLALAIAVLWTRSSFEPRFDAGIAADFGRYGLPIAAASALSYFVWQGDDWLVRWFRGGAELGGYQVAYNIPRYMTQFVGMSGAVLYPILARYKENQERRRVVFEAMNHLSAIVVLPVAVVLILFGEQVLETIYGAKWSGFGSVLSILAASFAVRAISGYHWTALVKVSGDTKVLLIGNLVNLGMLFGVGGILIERFGAHGGAYTSVVVVLAGVLPVRLFVVKRNLGSLSFVAMLPRPVLVATVGAAAAYGALSWGGLRWTSALLVCLLVYAAGIAWLERRPIRYSLDCLVGEGDPCSI